MKKIGVAGLQREQIKKTIEATARLFRSFHSQRHGSGNESEIRATGLLHRCV